VCLQLECVQLSTGALEYWWPRPGHEGNVTQTLLSAMSQQASLDSVEPQTPAGRGF
jgi:hypothetical protein